jgi:hypothetical protein
VHARSPPPVNIAHADDVTYAVLDLVDGTTLTTTQRHHRHTVTGAEVPHHGRVDITYRGAVGSTGARPGPYSMTGTLAGSGSSARCQKWTLDVVVKRACSDDIPCSQSPSPPSTILPVRIHHRHM